jgi:hypothetical protein
MQNAALQKSACCRFRLIWPVTSFVEKAIASAVIWVKLIN